MPKTRHRYRSTSDPVGTSESTNRTWCVMPTPRRGRSGARSRRAPDRADRQPTGAAPDGAPQPRDPEQQAREICLRLLSHRPRTRAELETALRRKEIPLEVVSAVLDRYGEVGLIDDAAFARAWVSSRHHGRGLARRALASELRRRGVASETAGDALAEVDAETEETTARQLVERRLRTMRGASPESAFRRLLGMLARKGYPPGVAVRVVRDALAADSETASFATGVDGVEFDGLADALDATDIDRPSRYE